MAGSAWSVIWLTSMVLIVMALSGGVVGAAKSDRWNPITSSAQANKTLVEAASLQADVDRKVIDNTEYKLRLDEDRQARVSQAREAERVARAENDAKIARYNQLTNTLSAMLTILATAVAAVVASGAVWLLRAVARGAQSSAAAAEDQAWLQEERRRLEIRERWMAQQAERQRQEMARAQQQAHALKLQMREMRHAELRRRAQEEKARGQAAPQSGAQAAPASPKIIPGPGNPRWPGKVDGSQGSTGSAPKAG